MHFPMECFTLDLGLTGLADALLGGLAANHAGAPAGGFRGLHNTSSEAPMWPESMGSLAGAHPLLSSFRADC